MKYLNSITQLLKKNKIQRYVYGIGLIIWFLAYFKEIKYLFQNFDKLHFSVLEEFWVAFSAPLILYTLQVILNNRKIWILILILTIISSVIVLWYIVVFNILVDFNRDYVSINFWTTKKITNLILTPLIIFFVNWITWKIKPIKNS